MVKVAHVVSSLQVGGAERFVIDLCEEQKNNHIQPVIVSLGEPGETLEQECRHFNTPAFSYANSLLIKLIKVFVQLRKCDVIHIHTPHALKFICPVLPLLNKKLIYTRHGAAALTGAQWLELHKKSQRYVDAITFVSQEGADNFHQAHGWQSTPSAVIDNGVLIQPIEKGNATASALRVGSVGRMIPLKNQISLLRAASLLPLSVQENLAIHFFGDGECVAHLQNYHKQQAWPVAVTFHGMVGDREQIYSNIDLLVVCSETEGLSMVIIEAMANKIPVIATNVGGNPKLVRNGETGWLFDYDDDEKLAILIQQMNDNRHLVAQLGDKAFNYISDNFSIQAAAKKYATLYEK
ncbi:Glycosyltransferase involved in cell wall bisynthesis [Colwellia chukchiensis]|uniref:Glycosyltransferase involved in cell wall bisynthesis n=1 Tax=Colwellia chukchiensis TaxID=641665 RepID=A0A1H7SHU4_9GAMM|nr:glycosyltransferase family 4 protein [Colwellia chukchiensis]SEL71037.1 Glycosyltransferase involved in cell wall bisynthesis [Colwellia chukchiensis]